MYLHIGKKCKCLYIHSVHLMFVILQVNSVNTEDLLTPLVPSSGISHYPHISELLYIFSLHTTISEMHCSSHTGALDEVSLGNASADAAAKRADFDGSPLHFYS